MFDLRHTLELIDDGALDEAIAALQRAIAQMPAYTPAYVLLAETYEAQGRWSKALTTWQQARFFAPNSPTVEAGLLRALDHQDIVPEAVADDEAPDVAPGDAMERMADELIDTLRSDTSPPPAPAHTEPEPARDAEPDPIEPPPPPLSDDDADGDDEDGSVLDDDADRSSPPPQDTSAEAGTPASSDTPEPPSAQPRPSPLEELAGRQPDADQPLPDDLQDLDRLIDELESARIDPQPDVGNAPEPNLDNDVDDMVSETLARIYIAQKQYAEAARVYIRLAHQDPDRAEEYHEKAAELREQARDANQ